jgi:hypothetical protein
LKGMLTLITVAEILSAAAVYSALWIIIEACQARSSRPISVRSQTTIRI